MHRELDEDDCIIAKAVSEEVTVALAVAMGVAKSSLCFNQCWHGDEAVVANSVEACL